MKFLIHAVSLLGVASTSLAYTIDKSCSNQENEIKMAGIKKAMAEATDILDNADKSADDCANAKGKLARQSCNSFGKGNFIESLYGKNNKRTYKQLGSTSSHSPLTPDS